MFAEQIPHCQQSGRQFLAVSSSPLGGDLQRGVLCGGKGSSFQMGPDVGLPVLVSHHRSECPQPAQGWHQDADRIFGPELNFVEVFYFPQDTPVELGPTELVPGTHIGPSSRAPDEAGVMSNGPAGTLGIP